MMAGFREAMRNPGLRPLEHRFSEYEEDHNKEPFMRGVFGTCLYEHRPGVAIPALARIAKEKGIDWRNNKEAMRGIIDEYLPIIQEARDKAKGMESQDTGDNLELGLAPRDFIRFLDSSMENIGGYRLHFDFKEARSRYVAE